MCVFIIYNLFIDSWREVVELAEPATVNLEVCVKLIKESVIKSNIFWR